MKKSKLDAIEELKAKHDAHMDTLSLYIPPDSRKPLIKESMDKFAALMKEIEEEKLSEEQIKTITKAIVESSDSMKYPKGGCSQTCLEAALKSHTLVMVKAFKHKLPETAVMGLLHMTTSMMMETLELMLRLANSNDKPWEAHEKTHLMLETTTKTFVEMAKSIDEGRVITEKLPSVDPSKYKQFMN